MNAILEPLLNSPRLFQYLGELETLAARERERRERFHAEITPEAKWEFINGEVIMHSPATAKHVRVRDRIQNLLNTFVMIHRLGWSGGEKALVCLTRNDYEPDIIFFGVEKARTISDDMLKFPAPDFAVEVLSETTHRRDRGIKYTDYAGHGVGEYWIVDPGSESIEQHLLSEDGTFELAAKQADGTIQSRVISGFVMPVRAAFDDDENLRALWALNPGTKS